jgi:hypothetical protein
VVFFSRVGRFEQSRQGLMCEPVLSNYGEKNMKKEDESGEVSR